MITWILLIIFVEAITEILVSSDIFLEIREFIYLNSNFLGKLVHCGYCTSVWVSAAVAWLAPSIGNYPFIEYIIAVFVIHRLSNIWHEFIARWLGRAPLTISLFTQKEEEENEN